MLTMYIFVCTLIARKEVVINAYQGTSGIFRQGVYGHRDRCGATINVVHGAPEKVWIEMMVKKSSEKNACDMRAAVKGGPHIS